MKAVRIVLVLWVLFAILWEIAPRIVQTIRTWWSNVDPFLVGFITVMAIVIIFKIISNIGYRKMITSGDYAKKYPQNKTQSGYSCNRCGSRSIRNWGVDGATDTNRVFICNHCNAHLYRN